MLADAVHLGLALGLRHASDADHICAVASLLRTGQSRSHALRTAAWWGLGHSMSFFSVGVLLLALDLQVPPVLEEIVGVCIAVLLVMLGVEQWRHAACVEHPVAGPRRSLTSLAIGALHGLAGSAGVSLLALTSMRDRGAALGFLVLFGVGTVAGMLLVTLALSWPLRLTHRLTHRWRTGVLRVAASGSIALGLWLLVSPHL